MDIYREDIKGKLKFLSAEQQLLFAALTCERLYPNYLYFHERFGWGNPKVLLDSIDIIYQSTFIKNLFDRNEIQQHIEAVDMVTPNTEDYSEVFVSFALDACTSVYSTLNFMLDESLDHIADVASYARDTVDMFIQVRDNIDTHFKDLETKIASDPLMIQEKGRQLSIIEKLKSLKEKDITDNLIEALRDKSFVIDIEVIS
ncbi:hypothetical protein DBR40_23545 [Pedobacter sp. KBW01]|uniref:DUF416 family protein n=1 Tax=Pedobacter sp. KBW01 TaxID=2153364 RepID=UPI000F5B3FD3|nr:DUF416 family protein [Pedobacter sp. KBW01]RQO65477.1 hypothetical protein DBR40_23545 [Pedobacter sp. KBW01]